MTPIVATQAPQALASFSAPQTYGGGVQHPPPAYAQPVPVQAAPPGGGANLQASIAAAQAIAARRVFIPSHILLIKPS